jgi:hypothetical protein
VEVVKINVQAWNVERKLRVLNAEAADVVVTSYP